MKLTFEVPGTPKGKARARKGKQGYYTPAETTAYQNTVALFFKSAWQQVSRTCHWEMEPWKGPVGMKLTGYFPVPVSWSEWKKDLVQHGDDYGYLPTLAAHDINFRYIAKPDFDNVEKAVLDALEGLLYKNDSQVFSRGFSKFYSHNPRLVVEVETLPDFAHMTKREFEDIGSK